MTADRVDLGSRVADLQAAAEALATEGDERAISAWLDELFSTSLATRDVKVAARQSAKLDRLLVNLPSDEAGAVFMRGYLRALLHQLDRHAAELTQERDILQREQDAVGVRERVLALLHEHDTLLSGEVAEKLGIAPSQASRALRELRERGAVTRAPREPGDHDGRVHRYRAAAVTPQAA